MRNGPSCVGRLIKVLQTSRNSVSIMDISHRYTVADCVDGELASNKSAFSMKFNTGLWILTTGLQLAVGWWYRRAAVFYLPPGWLGPLTWRLGEIRSFKQFRPALRDIPSRIPSCHKPSIHVVIRNHFLLACSFST